MVVGLTPLGMAIGTLNNYRQKSEIAKKSEDKGIKGKQIEKIAGLINKKLEKGDIDKLINLLERK